MNFNFLKPITIVALATSILASTSLTSFAAYEELVVPVYTQEKDQWCWAASALMAGEYSYSASSASQSDLVSHVKGSAVNKPGSIWETENALEYATDDTLGASALLGTWTLTKLKGAIDKDYPVLIRIETNINSGHFLVVRGYSTTNDNLVLNDPWTGTRETGSYAQIKNGTWAHDKRKYANTVYFNDSK